MRLVIGLAPVMALSLSLGLALGLAMASPAAALGTFPTVTADDLNGVSKTLPADLPGEPTIVFVAYKRNQQPDVNSWINRLGLDPYRGAEFVEVPVVGQSTKLIRSVVDNGMRSGITDTNMRGRTITLYENVKFVNEPLGFKGRNEIRVLIVRQDGDVLWSTSGPATASGIAELQAAYAAAN